jgi:hypothetical protein
MIATTGGPGLARARAYCAENPRGRVRPSARVPELVLITSSCHRSRMMADLGCRRGKGTRFSAAGCLGAGPGPEPCSEGPVDGCRGRWTAAAEAIGKVANATKVGQKLMKKVRKIQ